MTISTLSDANRCERSRQSQSRREAWVDYRNLEDDLKIGYVGIFGQLRIEGCCVSANIRNQVC